jgi:TRAP-type mannitol/chloroaromatic compound transport system permease small subunit
MLVKALSLYINIVDKSINAFGKFIGWLTFLVVVISFAIVLLRYGFSLGWIGLQESVLYFHGLVFMVGSAYTLKHDGHVRVDIFYQHYSERKKAWVNLFGALFLALPICIFIYIVSVDYVILSWQILEQSKEPGGLPFVYINKSMILLFVFTLSMQVLAEAARNLVFILKEGDK